VTVKSETASSLADNLRFLRALLARPRNIGAIVPSGPALSRAIARQIDPDIPGPVLELGPGTGVVTQALLERGIAAGRLTVIEYDPQMAACLTKRFAGVHVIEGDAFDLDRTLAGRPATPFSAIVSGIPLLNFAVPERRAFMSRLIRRLTPGGPLIQFSYGMNAPVAPPPGHSVARAAFVLANIPPARVWTYRKS
jgi:phosphatidylethanolamine/phosphatidyl-N-methylethanolamine N-methyltransferase